MRGCVYCKKNVASQIDFSAQLYVFTTFLRQNNDKCWKILILCTLIPRLNVKFIGMDMVPVPGDGGIKDEIEKLIPKGVGMANPMEDMMGGSDNPMNAMKNPMEDMMGGMNSPMDPMEDSGSTNPMEDMMGGMKNPMEDMMKELDNPKKNMMGGIKNPMEDMMSDMNKPVDSHLGGPI